MGVRRKKRRKKAILVLSQVVSEKERRKNVGETDRVCVIQFVRVHAFQQDTFLFGEFLDKPHGEVEVYVDEDE